MTVAEWWDRWWPTVTNLRPSTRARDEQYFRTHALPVFGSTPIGKLDRTALRAWVADMGRPDRSDLAPATIRRVVQLMNKCINAARKRHAHRSVLAATALVLLYVADRQH